MSKIVTMSGAPLLGWKDALQALIDRDDIKHVVIVINRKDDFMEVTYDRQTISEVAFAASVLSVAADDLTRQSLVCGHE